MDEEFYLMDDDAQVGWLDGDEKEPDPEER